MPKAIAVILDGLLLSVALKIAIELGDSPQSVQQVVSRDFLIFVAPAWFLVTLMSAKFTAPVTDGYLPAIRRFLHAQFIVGMLVASGLYIRLHPVDLTPVGLNAPFTVSQTLYSVLLIHLMLELGLQTAWHYLASRQDGARGLPFEVILMLLDSSAITVLFFTLNLVWLGSYIPEPTYPVVLLTIIATWLLIAPRIHGFRIDIDRKLAHVVATFVVAQVLVAGAVMLVLVLTPYRHSRLVVFGTLVGFAIIENACVGVYHIRLRRRGSDVGLGRLRPVSDSVEGDPPTDWIGPESPTKYSVPLPIQDREALGQPHHAFQAHSLSKPLLRFHLDRLFGTEQRPFLLLLDRVLELDHFDLLQTAVVATDNERSIGMFAEGVFELFINLERVNNVLRIDRFFFAMNRRLCAGGVLVGVFQTQAQRRRRQYADHHLAVAVVLDSLDFVWRRVCSKLPLIRDFHFALTKGSDRVLSLTECMGRIGFAGFEVIGLEEVGDSYVFVARKVRDPENRKSPEYGLIFRQQRVGRFGQPVSVYKLRTMHPYAEFLHLRLIRQRGFDSGGKTKGDFRITGWGRVLRRFWIDELPMVFNLLRGDLKLVGVRPVSRAFFSLYPEDLRLERLKVRPGLIPPFYADLPKDLDAIFESERQYLERYHRSPLRCDIWYFLAAVRNILFRQARSS